MNRKKLKEKLTKIFHKWIKVKYSIDDYCACFTCPNNLPLGSPFLHAGHFIPKSVAPGLRFNPDNVRPQCQTCNFDGGKPKAFEKALREEIGNDRVDWLLENKYLSESKYSIEWFQEQIEFYSKYDFNEF